MSTRAQPRPARAAAPGGGSTDARRSRRVVPSRRAGRRRFRILLLAAVVALLVAIVWGVSVSPLLDVDHVEVRGLDHLTTSEIQAAADVHAGDAMLWLDPDRAVRDLEALPYVGRASVTREWPDTVRVTVRERRPAAWVEGAAGKVVVDGTGRVLEAVAAPPAGLPQLLGTKIVPPVGATVAPVDGARVAGGLTGLAAAGTASVEVTDHGVLLHLVAGPEIRMGTATQIAVKVRAALAVLGASAGVPVQYVDVSVPTNPVAG